MIRFGIKRGRFYELLSCFRTHENFRKEPTDMDTSTISWLNFALLVITTTIAIFSKKLKSRLNRKGIGRVSKRTLLSEKTQVNHHCMQICCSFRKRETLASIYYAATFRNSAVLLIVMKCNWLTIITRLIYLHCDFQIYLLFLCFEHAFCWVGLGVQGEKCQFCTFYFVSVSISSLLLDQMKSSLRQYKFTLHDHSPAFCYARERKSKDVYEIEIRWMIFPQHAVRNVLELEIEIVAIWFRWHLIAAWLINELFIGERSEP